MFFQLFCLFPVKTTVIACSASVLQIEGFSVIKSLFEAVLNRTGFQLEFTFIQRNAYTANSSTKQKFSTKNLTPRLMCQRLKIQLVFNLQAAVIDRRRLIFCYEMITCNANVSMVTMLCLFFNVMLILAAYSGQSLPKGGEVNRQRQS